MTRAQFARLWWDAIAELPDKPFKRLAPHDADRDGVPDGDDALPFDARPSTWPAESNESPGEDEDGRPATLKANASPRARQFNFAARNTRSVNGFVTDHGATFDAKRGYGWSRDKRASHRRRASVSDPLGGTFVFTRKQDTWEVNAPDGKLRVTVCIGDGEFDQPGQNVRVEGKIVFENHSTLAGRFAEKTIEVIVLDGRLTLDIGTPEATTNTCVNWIRIESPAPSAP